MASYPTKLGLIMAFRMQGGREGDSGKGTKTWWEPGGAGRPQAMAQRMSSGCESQWSRGLSSLSGRPKLGGAPKPTGYPQLSRMKDSE